MGNLVRRNGVYVRACVRAFGNGARACGCFRAGIILAFPGGCVCVCVRIFGFFRNQCLFFKNLFLLIFYNYYYLFSWLTIIIFSHKKFKNALFWKLQKKILIYIYLYTWIPIIMYTVFVIINLIGLIVL